MIKLSARSIDLTGRRFGKLSILAPVKKIRGQVYWRCRCDCGSIKETRGNHLTSGRIVSCGCAKIKHGYAKTREWNIWYGIKRRCFEPGHKSYRDYGGRGITMCDRWLEFANFLDDMGLAPAGYSIERKDVNGNYEPDNCLWVPMAQQSGNRRSHKEVVLERMTVAELEIEIARKKGELGVFG